MNQNPETLKVVISIIVFFLLVTAALVCMYRDRRKKEPKVTNPLILNGRDSRSLIFFEDKLKKFTSADLKIICEMVFKYIKVKISPSELFCINASWGDRFSIFFLGEENQPALFSVDMEQQDSTAIWNILEGYEGGIPTASELQEEEEKSSYDPQLREHDELLVKLAQTGADRSTIERALYNRNQYVLSTVTDPRVRFE